MASIMRRKPGALGRMASGFDPWFEPPDPLSWDPFQTLSQLLPMGEGLARFAPDFDVRETDKEYQFTADIPGIGEEDLDVCISGNRLTISGVREPEQEQPSETAYVAERAYGAFTRTFTLPGDIDSDRVRAELRDGVLRLHVAKAAAAEPRHIPVAGEEKAPATRQVRQRGEPAAAAATPDKPAATPDKSAADEPAADEPRQELLEPP